MDDLSQKVYQLYFVELLRMRKVCKQLHIGERTFANVLNKNGWKKREKHKTIKTTELKERPYIQKDWLIEQYVTKMKTCLQIAQEIGVGESTIQYWISFFDIKCHKSNLGKIFSKEWRDKLSQSHIGIMVGERNVNWRGGVNLGNRTERQSNEYRTWRKEVFIRDNFKCTSCGKGGRIQAHHIQFFSTHKDLRYEIDNGITLCIKCHKKIHRRVVSGEETKLVPA